MELIQLALNEECRALGRGTFYSAALRQETNTGTPCDLAFIDERWGRESLEAWNRANWAERLELCRAGMYCFVCYVGLGFVKSMNSS